MSSRLRELLSILLPTISPQVIAASALYGRTVRSAWYCCIAPTEPYRPTDFASAVVGDATESLQTASDWLGQGGVSGGGTIDVKQTTIEIRSTENATANSAIAFGGLTLNVIGAPNIVRMTLGGSGNAMPSDMVLAQDAILTNASGVACTDTSISILNIELATMPEPDSPALLLVGPLFLPALCRIADERQAKLFSRPERF